MIVYVDTSAHLKSIVREVESIAYRTYLDRARARGDRVVSSSLLITELGRAASRAGVERTTIDDALNVVTLIACTNVRLGEAAGVVPATVRSLDAIHLASAQYLGADVMVTYDKRRSAAGSDAGIEVVQPS